MPFYKSFFLPIRLRCSFRNADLKKVVNETSFTSLNFEPKPGLEPGTYSLRMNCSTN